MNTQQKNPITRGFPPVLINFTILVFNPIAPVAIIIKNLLIVFIGLNTLPGTPHCTATVVITDASTKYRMKNF